MLFILIILVFVLVFSFKDHSKEENEKAKQDFERLTGHKYK